MVTETLSNAPPSFSSQDEDNITNGVQVTRSKSENSKGNLGEPITSTDADGDPRLYTISGADKDCFSIGKTTGQLGLSAERDFESAASPCKDGGAARTAGDNTYDVVITATDPSSATGSAMVTVTITDANEPAKFTGDAKADSQKTLYIDENVKSADSPALALRTGSASTADAPDPYVATDEDRDENDAEVDTVTYKVEGADAKHFEIIDSPAGTLSIKTGEDLLSTDGANFEGKPSYSITIVAISTGTGDDDADTPRGKRFATLGVTIKVVDREDVGEVTFPTVREPQEGKSVLAKLTDEDGGETGVEWQWARGDLVDGDDTDDLENECPAAGATSSDENFEGWKDISKANSATYTPGSDTFDHDDDAISAEVPYCLRATATYTDDLDSDQDTTTPEVVDLEEMAQGVMERPVQEDAAANAAPEFERDQDPSTPGNQAVAERSVKENAKGEKVGEPVVADDSDLLVYSDDSDYFDVNNNGQITTAKELDYESLPEDAKYYMVMLTATDPSGATGTVMVKITVTDEDDPAEITGVEKFSYDENGDEAVATFTASDPDADADDIEWSLKGVDADDFEIEGGVLTFKKKPNYEGATDRDEDPDTSVAEGAKDNKYQITVVASGGEVDVVVTVVNIDEDGSVSFTQLQAQATRSLAASYSDDDKPEKPSWQWSRGASADGPWTDIDGATSSDRMPDEDNDVGNWLRATVSYTDSFGAQTASGVIGPVMTETLSNAPPSFSSHDEDDITAEVQVTRSKGENSKGNLGEPIAATDANGDPRLYTKSGADADCFSIGKTTGQLGLSAERDFESAASPCKDGGAARTAGDNTYDVVITATDPSSATGSAMVTVTITDANEPAKFTGDAKADSQKTLYIDENVKSADSPALALRTGSASTADAPDPYVATDEDRDENDAEVDTVTYKVEGADAKHFEIIDSPAGTLSIKTGEDLLSTDGANFEGKPSYSITIVAISTGTGDDDADTPRGKRFATLGVTIKVVDREDVGEVTFPTVREPQEGKSVLAKLTDEDGGETGVKWEWARSVLVDSDTTDADDTADDCAAAGADSWLDIPKANSASYTPGSDTFDDNDDAIVDGAVNPIATAEVPYCLRATATYTDDLDSDQDTTTPEVVDLEEMAQGVMERPVQADNPANAAPEFDRDQDPSTPGIQAVAERSVKENAKGEKVGEPVVADDSDLLVYSISDTANFSVNNNGQISTKVELDYEALPEDAKYHMVMLTATDPSGATDDVMVKITVTDEDDSAIISLRPAANVAPAFADDAAEFMVYENMADGTEVGMVMATDGNDDTLTYSDGSGYFDVDDMGQITTTMMLDYEAMASHMVTITATDSDGASDSIDVTVTVGDAHPDCTVMDNMGLTNDCEALLDAKGDLGGDLNWDTDTAMDDWEGVTMSDGRVSGIWLRDEGLDGSVSAALGRLDMLTVLNLHTNMLSGTIPDLSGASMLEELYLANNDLTGGIPEWLNGSTNLTELWLWGNELTGGIPDLSALTSLDKLKLANNDLSGGLPTADMLPPNVTWLIIDRNPFGGDIPDLSSLSSLRLLWLHSSELTGSVPSGGMLPASLDDLNLRDNMLMGAIPDLSALDNLTRLRLHNNSLSGAVPGSLGGLDSLKQLWLHNETDEDGMLIGNNMFTSIDDGVGDLSTTLIEIALSGNMWADDACVPIALADVATNDYGPDNIEVCPADDGS